MNRTSFPAAYGSNFCPLCDLTVAEFINGCSYTLASQQTIYIHHLCLATSTDHYNLGGIHHA
jgi:hypothetical protein